MSRGTQQGYPWDGPDDDVIADADEELEEGPTATMACSPDRTNYIRSGKHGFHIDEPEVMNHSFKKGTGGKNEAPSALAYLQAAAMGCQVNTLELLLNKSRIDDYDVDAECTAYSYMEDDIKRVQRLDIAIDLTVPEDARSRAERCLNLYEKGCMVGESIKRGIDVRVERTLHTRTDTEE